MTTFEDFSNEIEAEARAQGPDALAELEAFRLHFSLARQLSAQRGAQHLTQKQPTSGHRDRGRDAQARARASLPKRATD